MKLNEISNNPGAHKRKDKVGRGSSSGLGKTSGRGVKGAKARTGTKVYGFEGGQMPLHMRMPKRGFNNIFANDFVGSESRPHAEGDRRQAPRRLPARSPKRCCARPAWSHKSRDGVRLLGKGEITAKIDIEVAGASAGASEAVEKAGGTRHHDLQEEGLHEQEGRAGQAPEAPRRSRRKAGGPQG